MEEGDVLLLLIGSLSATVVWASVFFVYRFNQKISDLTSHAQAFTEGFDYCRSTTSRVPLAPTACAGYSGPPDPNSDKYA